MCTPNIIAADPSVTTIVLDNLLRVADVKYWSNLGRAEHDMVSLSSDSIFSGRTSPWLVLAGFGDCRLV